MKIEWRKCKKHLTQLTVTKNIEEIKNKQTEMNNSIIDIKNILEGINSTITEAEEWISELEDRMVEITVEEQNKRKGMKRLRIASEAFGTILSKSTVELYGSQRKEKKRH